MGELVLAYGAGGEGELELGMVGVSLLFSDSQLLTSYTRMKQEFHTG